MTRVLSAQECAFFDREGYLLPKRQLMPSGAFENLRQRFEELLVQWTDAGRRPEHMDVPHLTHPDLLQWLAHAQVLDVVEDLLGRDILLFSSHFICKPAGDGKAVPWHEDSAYWKGFFDPMEVVTIWLAIDPSLQENGCMQVIPGSHENGYSAYEPVTDQEGAVFAEEIRADQFDASQAVDCVLAAGEYSIHHARCIHGSQPNRSSLRRCGLTMRFVPAGSRFHPECMPVANHEVFLVRGRDLAGNGLTIVDGLG